MPIKQIWNNKVAKEFENMTFDEQSALYRSFKRQFDKLSEYNLKTANEYYYDYLEQTIIFACNGDAVAQDFLCYIYKKGRSELFEDNLLLAYKWGIVASASGNKLSMTRLKFFFQPAFYIIAEHPKLDEVIKNYNLTSDNIEYFFASALSDMIMSVSNVNLKELSKLPVIPEKNADEELRELERIRDRVIENMMSLL